MKGSERKEGNAGESILERLEVRLLDGLVQRLLGTPGSSSDQHVEVSRQMGPEREPAHTHHRPGSSEDYLSPNPEKRVRTSTNEECTPSVQKGTTIREGWGEMTANRSETKPASQWKEYVDRLLARAQARHEENPDPRAETQKGGGNLFLTTKAPNGRE